MKNLVLLSVMFFSTIAMAGNDGPGNVKTHKFETKKGFNYKKHQKRHKKARKHSPCRHVNFN
jgi:hypothetical protein